MIGGFLPLLLGVLGLLVSTVISFIKGKGGLQTDYQRRPHRSIPRIKKIYISFEIKPIDNFVNNSWGHQVRNKKKLDGVFSNFTKKDGKEQIAFFKMKVRAITNEHDIAKAISDTDNGLLNRMDIKRRLMDH